ncbi:RHS repeat-associated core domain-containing protein [Chitinophaga agri]|uniref:Type IV secretion protein Rhs n=1 Tax=Chitinophaga agri TaxID=2703787 RepID=A0A6B9ZQ67_9BACT|nr:RHS repeat-associated core domain-containing protein [Chitinophaga agri]QHS63724.1 hypothetical protein GWR21_30325 [Chitinophaga agri]
MLVSNKHFTPVIGLDIHIVILFGFPIPLPHPYIGFVMDPMDYIPFVGATTKVNHVPRGKSDTSGIIIILFHIPMGGPFLLTPMIGHDSVNFFGSKKVTVEGNLMTPAGHMLMTCNDIGIPLSLQPGKKLKPIPSMYLPTSFSIPLSFGKPVMVGGPYVPDWSGALLNLVASFGFGALMKGIGKLGKKALKRFNHALQKKIGSNKLSSFLCKKGFEPVDLVQGIVIYDGIDFTLQGPIPLIWSRSWNSDSPHTGTLGHGTHLRYDMQVLEYPEEDITAVLLGHGRSALFGQLAYAGESDFHRSENLTLTRTDIDRYELFDHQERLLYLFEQLQPGTGKYQLHAIKNEAGFAIRFFYDHSARLTAMTDSAGRQLKIKNDLNGCITAVTAHHRGQQRTLISYAYNAAGDLTAITDANGATTSIEYRDHLMIKKTDRGGQSFYWEYDNRKRCVHTWGDGGLLEGWIAYHPEEGYNDVTDALGNTTRYHYTADFLVTQITDALGYSRFYEYTEDFELYREIDEEGTLKGYVYDDRGNCIKVDQPDGSSYTFAYDDTGRMLVSKDPQGNTRSFVYYEDEKKKGLLHTVTDTATSMVTFYYNENNLLSHIINHKRHRTLLEYDDDHNLSLLVSPDGGRSTWEYDNWGQCMITRNPLGQARYFKYDALGRVTDLILPDGNEIKLQYNAYEEVIWLKDKHRELRFDYTPMGRLKLREENGVKQHFLYNRNEQLTALINEHGEKYSFTRNNRGDIIGETGFDGQQKRYELDATGKILKMIRPGKRWSDYEYDVNGRLTRAEHSDGCWQTFTYDRNGRVIEAVNEHSTVRIERDPMGNVLREWQNGHVVSATYDRLGQRSGIQSSLGADISLERNIMGHVTATHARMGESEDPWDVYILRNHLGMEIERSLPGGVKSSWIFDDAGMPAAHFVDSNAREMRRRHYRWDANHQLKQIVDGISKGVVKFGQDDFSNLAWAQYEDGQYDYRLPDKVGNLYRSQLRKDRKYGAGGQLLEAANARFMYDEEGNLTRKIAAGGKIWEYEWYGTGMLKQVVRPDGKTVAFRYDALGRRIEKIYQDKIFRFVWDSDVLLHEWSYAVKDRPVITIDELGNIRQGSPEPVPPETLVTWVFNEGTFVPAARIAGNEQYSVITDHLGTPCEVYDARGERVWNCELDVYGNVRRLTGDKQLIPFRYQGQYDDAETGLYYNRFRYYSPEEGGYISQDPSGLNGGMRLYGYVNTTDYVDPMGLIPVPPQGPVTPLKSPPTDAMMRARADELAEMYGSSKGWKTVAVAHAIDPKTGDHFLVISASDNHLRPVIREDAIDASKGEMRAHGKGHAEVTAINFAEGKGLKVESVAASRPICGNCEDFIKKKGVRPASDLKSALTGASTCK